MFVCTAAIDVCLRQRPAERPGTRCAADVLHANHRPGDPDWMMLPMSGCEFLRELRRPERAIKVPVIALSASSEPRDVAMARQFTISGWLTKPIALPELRRLIPEGLTLI